MKGPYHVVHESYDSYVTRKLNDPVKLSMLFGGLMAFSGFFLAIHEIVSPTGLPINLLDPALAVGGAGVLLFLYGYWMWKRGK